MQVLLAVSCGGAMLSELAPAYNALREQGCEVTICIESWSAEGQVCPAPSCRSVICAVKRKKRKKTPVGVCEGALQQLA